MRIDETLDFLRQAFMDGNQGIWMAIYFKGVMRPYLVSIEIGEKTTEEEAIDAMRIVGGRFSGYPVQVAGFMAPCHHGNLGIMSSAYTDRLLLGAYDLEYDHEVMKAYGIKCDSKGKWHEQEIVINTDRGDDAQGLEGLYAFLDGYYKS